MKAQRCQSGGGSSELLAPAAASQRLRRRPSRRDARSVGGQKRRSNGTTPKPHGVRPTRAAAGLPPGGCCVQCSTGSRLPTDRSSCGSSTLMRVTQTHLISLPHRALPQCNHFHLLAMHCLPLSHCHTPVTTAFPLRMLVHCVLRVLRLHSHCRTYTSISFK